MEVIRERLNLTDSFSKEEQPIYINFRNHKNLWQILSFISWVLLISAQLNTIQLNIPFNYIDLICIAKTTYHVDYFRFYNLFPQILFLTLTLIGFINYLISTVYLRDEKVYIGLFDNFAKFHFIPFLAIAGIYMTNEIFADLIYYVECLYINTALSLAALVLLIIVYAKIKLASKWFLVLFIKKGTFSGLIILLWGNITLNIYIFLAIYRAKDEVYPSIIFPIITGIGAIVFSFIFKDVMVLMINLIYNIKIIQNLYNIYYAYQDFYWINYQLGFISLIMLILTLISLLIIVIKFKQRIYES